MLNEARGTFSHKYAEIRNHAVAKGGITCAYLALDPVERGSAWHAQLKAQFRERIRVRIRL